MPGDQFHVYARIVENVETFGGKDRRAVGEKGKDAQRHRRQGRHVPQVAELFAHGLRSADHMAQDAFLQQDCEPVIALAQNPLPVHTYPDRGGHVVGDLAHLSDPAEHGGYVVGSLQWTRDGL